MKKKNWLVLFFSLFCLFVLGSSAEANQLSFYVEPQLPENQVDKNVTYYDLRVKPEQQQDLTIKVTNGSDKEITVLPKINSAITNINGVVEYGPSKKKVDKTAPMNIKEVVTLEENQKI